MLNNYTIDYKSRLISLKLLPLMYWLEIQDVLFLLNEQLVMERTGHRSIEGVRSYKRTGENQRKVLSDILNRQQTTNSQSEQSLEVVSASQPLPQLPAFLPGLSAASLSPQTFNHCTVHLHAAPSATPCSKKRRDRRLRQRLDQHHTCSLLSYVFIMLFPVHRVIISCVHSLASK